MRNGELARRVKELRNRKGFSQEELAEESGLSLRTIQRIENGETEPRGDSLKRLAATFDVPPEEISDWQIIEDNSVINIMSLSQLSFLAFPLLGIIVPLTIWIMKKDKIKNVDRMGKSILNFQITWSLILFSIGFVVLLNGIFDPKPWLSVSILVLVLGAMYAFNILAILVNTIRGQDGRIVRYYPAVRILR